MLSGTKPSSYPLIYNIRLSWGSPETVDSDQRPVTVSLWATVNCC